MRWKGTSHRNQSDFTKYYCYLMVMRGCFLPTILTIDKKTASVTHNSSNYFWVWFCSFSTTEDLGAPKELPTGKKKDEKAICRGLGDDPWQ